MNSLTLSARQLFRNRVRSGSGEGEIEIILQRQGWLPPIRKARAVYLGLLESAFCIDKIKRTRQAPSPPTQVEKVHGVDGLSRVGGDLVEDAGLLQDQGREEALFPEIIRDGLVKPGGPVGFLNNPADVPMGVRARDGWPVIEMFQEADRPSRIHLDISLQSVYQADDGGDHVRVNHWRSRPLTRPIGGRRFCWGKMLDQHPNKGREQPVEVNGRRIG